MLFLKNAYLKIANSHKIKYNFKLVYEFIPKNNLYYISK